MMHGLRTAGVLNVIVGSILLGCILLTIAVSMVIVPSSRLAFANRVGTAIGWAAIPVLVSFLVSVFSLISLRSSLIFAIVTTGLVMWFWSEEAMRINVREAVAREVGRMAFEEFRRTGNISSETVRTLPDKEMIEAFSRGFAGAAIWKARAIYVPISILAASLGAGLGWGLRRLIRMR